MAMPFNGHTSPSGLSNHGTGRADVPSHDNRPLATVNGQRPAVHVSSDTSPDSAAALFSSRPFPLGGPLLKLGISTRTEPNQEEPRNRHGECMDPALPPQQPRGHHSDQTTEEHE